jgi:hypothetical protein
MIAEARMKTEQASRYLAELCRRLDQTGRVNPDHGVHVRWNDTEGTIDFGWARCTVVALPEALELHAEAADADGLAQICELISRHVEQHAGSVGIWRQDGTPVRTTPREGRDAMRAFHRRMRH